MKIERKFYARSAIEVAKDLLGKVIVHEVDGITLKGKIVETEAYIGAIDKASHAYGGKKTERVMPLYGKPGTAYVYLIYGMYHCFNVITKIEGEAEGVLIRGVEPLDGINKMSYLRYNKPIAEISKAQFKNLTTGPGKLCIALKINKDNNKHDLCDNGLLYIEYNDKEDFNIVESKRVGIDYAEEAKDFLWRFYIEDNPWISKK